MTETGSITFVPSVHFSPTHRRRVRETIRDVEPDVVAVELDDYRFDRLDRRVDPAELARQLPPATAATYRALRTLQRTVVRLYGLDPGRTDMEAAIDAAAEQDVDVALIDEPIADTFRALSERVGVETIPKLLVRMQLQGPQTPADQMELLTLPFEDITSGDDVQPAIDQLRRLLPEVAEVLIDDRDRVMAERLDALRREGHDVVAVVGAGHHNGIRAHLDALADRETPPAVAVPRRTPRRTVTQIPIE